MKNLINIGFNNFIPKNRIISVVNYNAAPIKRMKKTAKEKLLLIDATNGRKTRAVIITDSGHVILSSANSETLSARMEQ